MRPVKIAIDRSIDRSSIVERPAISFNDLSSRVSRESLATARLEPLRDIDISMRLDRSETRTMARAHQTSTSHSEAFSSDIPEISAATATRQCR